MADYEDGNLRVNIQDTGVPSGGRFVAEIELWIEGNEHPTFQYYVNAVTKDEALQLAKDWINEYRAEIR
jgi:hypothetical protein